MGKVGSRTDNSQQKSTLSRLRIIQVQRWWHWHLSSTNCSYYSLLINITVLLQMSNICPAFNFMLMCKVTMTFTGNLQSYKRTIVCALKYKVLRRCMCHTCAGHHDESLEEIEEIRASSWQGTMGTMEFLLKCCTYYSTASMEWQWIFTPFWEQLGSTF